MKRCPYCGCEDIEYIGIEDGAGDYGEIVEDTYSCWGCSAHFSIYAVVDDSDPSDPDTAMMDDLYADYPPDDPDDMARRRA